MIETLEDKAISESTQAHRERVYRPFQFRECGQDFIGTHDEALSVAMRIDNPDCSPARIPVETQSKLQTVRLGCLAAKVGSLASQRLYQKTGQS